MIVQKRILPAMLAAALLSVLFAACTIEHGSIIAMGTSIHMGATGFDVNTATIDRGQRLTLTNDADDVHIITNGAWDGQIQKPFKEKGAPAIDLIFRGPESLSTGPFNTPGTYYIYDILHPGATLSISVH
jgi:plastocyanin